MRLFTGIALAPDVIDKLSALLEELKSTAALNWSPIQNLHITCKFIGAWQEERLPDLKAALSNVRAACPIPIAISRFGFLPNPHRPHSFFAAVQSGPALSELATAIDRALVPLGCQPETRAFQPHVTLARITMGRNRSGDLHRLREQIATTTDFDFASFTAREFHLYLSQPAAFLSQAAAPGSVYTKLATYDLVREQNTI